MSCIWTTSDRPRVLLGRHVDTCGSDLCRGCQPCREPHCRVCNRTHADGTCAECMADARETLREIARMCDALPDEVKSRGAAGEAMMLLGPVVDPEAWGHVSASVASGRLPADWIEGGGELHPATVLLTWQMVWRDALEHDEAPDADLATAVDYLDRTMTYMGGYEHVPFEDFAKDLRRCAGHLEVVLHDGEQVERSNVRCLEEDCEAALVKVYSTTEDHDGWVCSRRTCASHYDHARYARALHQQLASEGAERWVRVSEALAVIPRPEMTLRTWITNGEVASHRDDQGTVKVWWPDVRRKHINSAKRTRKPKSCA